MLLSLRAHRAVHVVVQSSDPGRFRGYGGANERFGQVKGVGWAVLR